MNCRENHARTRLSEAMIAALLTAVFLLVAPARADQGETTNGPQPAAAPARAPETAAEATPSDAPAPAPQQPEGPPDNHQDEPGAPAPQEEFQYPTWDDTDKSDVPGKLTDEAVSAAVGRGVEYLRKSHDKNGLFLGNYSLSGRYKCGETALALLAMRYAGVGLTDPAYQKGEKVLLELSTKYTYEASLVAQVLSMVPTNKHTPPLRRAMTVLANFLCNSQLPNGMWTYQPRDPKSAQGGWLAYGDNSNTQFAVLGLWQLAEAGIEFDLNALRRCEAHFLETQLANGGWSYTPPQAYAAAAQGAQLRTVPSTPSMTATGLASLYIFADLLHMYDEGAFNGRAAVSCGREQRLDVRMDAAMKQAEKDFGRFVARWAKTPTTQPTGVVVRTNGIAMHDLYYLYSVERVGAASGQKHLGAIDWYRAGAKLLLGQQNADGSWGASQVVPAGRQQQQKAVCCIVETSLAILFLAKGRSPILFSKLRYDGDWNNDRRDVANAARYASKALEQHFNWVVVDAKSDVDGWFDSPVLYFNGHEGPKFDADDRKKLADYVKRGGFLFAEACCGREKFTTAVRKLGEELWPDLKWQELPDDHPIFTLKSHFDLKKHPRLLGLTDKDGFTFFVLSPEDVSCVWHQNLITTREEAFRFAINVYRYAARGKPIRARLED